MKFSKTLTYWYLKNNRELPWRKNQNPYHVWLSEIMLQQTKVSQGLPYFLKFIEVFPTIFDLAEAEENTVLKLWQGLGYYSRARNLHFTAKYIADELEGNFPNTYNELLKLKGVGDYTASAIASICFDESAAVVDGNVYRVLARFFGVKTPINSSKGRKEFKILAQTLIDTKQPGVYNQAIMDFGALHCKPKKPLCDDCPLEGCVAFEKKWVKELPVKEKKVKIRDRFFNYLVVVTDANTTILEERIGKGIWQGLYQFPLIETQQSIDEKELILSEEFTNLFPLETTVSLFNIKDIVHKLSHQHLHTKFWVIKTPRLKQANTSWKNIKKHPVPILIDKFLNSYLNSKK